MRKVVVTLMLDESSEEYIDLELPAEVPVERVTRLIASGLPIPAAVEGAVLDAKAVGEDWRELPADWTLTNAGVRDGSYLRFRHPVPDFTPTEELPVAGWKPLF
ncbi:EsaB/YukD family protein [Paenibacillus turpanensis]|uniref:EsaB/YukD family protein n=1 Tax=Paenibacillus turpanensis TaxID=2689078 RepID=UPI00140D6F32|nr:EsaB/YukD family protein [Paenibacillus turpanensis]